MSVVVGTKRPFTHIGEGIEFKQETIIKRVRLSGKICCCSECKQECNEDAVILKPCRHEFCMCCLINRIVESGIANMRNKHIVCPHCKKPQDRIVPVLQSSPVSFFNDAMHCIKAIQFPHKKGNESILFNFMKQMGRNKKTQTTFQKLLCFYVRVYENDSLAQRHHYGFAALWMAQSYPTKSAAYLKWIVKALEFDNVYAHWHMYNLDKNNNKKHLEAAIKNGENRQAMLEHARLSLAQSDVPKAIHVLETLFKKGHKGIAVCLSYCYFKQQSNDNDKDAALSELQRTEARRKQLHYLKIDMLERNNLDNAVPYLTAMQKDIAEHNDCLCHSCVEYAQVAQKYVSCHRDSRVHFLIALDARIQCLEKGIGVQREPAKAIEVLKETIAHSSVLIAAQCKYWMYLRCPTTMSNYLWEAASHSPSAQHHLGKQFMDSVVLMLEMAILMFETALKNNAKNTFFSGAFISDQLIRSDLEACRKKLTLKI